MDVNHLFLILNYNSFEDSINCIDSIRKISNNCRIVVVDNNSSNESFDILSKKFDIDKYVDIIKTNENLGFAKGNNFGYDYIKKEGYDFEFMHCINSDILIHDSNIFIEIEKCYDERKFYLMGPNIITNNKSISPIGVYKTTEDFYSGIKKLRLFTKIYSVIAFFLQPIMGTRLESKYSEINSKKIRKNLKLDDVPVLSGCYLVYSKDYFNDFDFLFLDITFLYCEESILTFLMMKNGIRKIVYNNDIDVIHNHAGSSKGNNKQKAKLVLENLKKMEEL